MAAVVQVLGLRLRVRWRALIVVGVVLGIGFGLSLASFAAARRTGSAYDRALREADAEDATISHNLPPDEADRTFSQVEGIVRTRTAVGFVGFFDGVDPALPAGSSARLAPARSRSSSHASAPAGCPHRMRRTRCSSATT